MTEPLYKRVSFVLQAQVNPNYSHVTMLAYQFMSEEKHGVAVVYYEAAALSHTAAQQRLVDCLQEAWTDANLIYATYGRKLVEITGPFVEM